MSVTGSIQRLRAVRQRVGGTAAHNDDGAGEQDEASSVRLWHGRRGDAHRLDCGGNRHRCVRRVKAWWIRCSRGFAERRERRGRLSRCRRGQYSNRACLRTRAGTSRRPSTPAHGDIRRRHHHEPVEEPLLRRLPLFQHNQSRAHFGNLGLAQPRLRTRDDAASHSDETFARSRVG